MSDTEDPLVHVVEMASKDRTAAALASLLPLVSDIESAARDVREYGQAVDLDALDRAVAALRRAL